MRNSVKNTVAAILMAMFVFAPAISAQSPFSDTKVTGYIGVDAPMHQNETYKVRWANVDFVGVPTLQPNMSVRIQQNFSSNKPSYLYIKRVDSVFGGEFVSMGGKVLSRSGNLMPGPNSIRTLRWEKAYDKFDVKSIGLSGSFEKNAVTIGAVHADNSSAAVTIYGVSAFWQENAGYGFTTKIPYGPAFAEGRIAASFPDADKEQASLLTCIHVTGKFSVNYIADIGDVNALTFGCAYEYATKSFVKVYFDIQDGSRGEFDVEFTCTF